MRPLSQRIWNWVPHSSDAIHAYLKALDPSLQEFEVMYSPSGIVIAVLTDHDGIACGFDSHFGISSACFSVSRQKSLNADMMLIYLANSPPVLCPFLMVPEHRLASNYNETDVVFDPLTYTALMHGPAKFGFVKSLVLGLVSYYLSAESVYGIHSGFVVRGSQGILFAGPHGAGKSSFALIFALTEPDATMLSDDWALCQRKRGETYGTPLEINAYLDPAVAERVLNAVPKSEVVNNGLQALLEDFVKNASRPQAEHSLRLDRRMDLRVAKKDNAHSSFKIENLVAIGVGLPDEKESLASIKAFVDLLIYSSYHIPFHSSASEASLRALGSRDQQDKDTRQGFDLVHSRLINERAFWTEVTKTSTILVFDTGDTDLWRRYSQLREML